MSDSLKSRLNEVNDISRRLLCQFERQIDPLDSTASLDNTRSTTNDTSLLSDPQLLTLVTERNTLITFLLTHFNQTQLGEQLPLVNEMVMLDEKLSLKSQHNKKILSEQVLKLRKSQKVASLYKKY